MSRAKRDPRRCHWPFCPWRLDEETESNLFLTHMSGKDARICFHVKAGGVIYYLTDLKLASHETRAIDLGRLTGWPPSTRPRPGGLSGTTYAGQ